MSQLSFNPPPRKLVNVARSEDVSPAVLEEIHEHVQAGGVVQVRTPCQAVEDLPYELRQLTQTNPGQENSDRLQALLRSGSTASAVHGEVDWTKVGLAAAVALATVGGAALAGAYCGGPAGALAGAAVGTVAAVTGAGVASATVGRRLTLRIMADRGTLELIINDGDAGEHTSKVCTVQ
eukprot:TRINITY_DN28740_c0_g1_i4.p1 TRINITY_DN28740_c0_g1~~TRINITY_DN28740_c0_g1_i4.p1  ORF type:complete len:179 (+),score=28.21 TRINITY_DN28740_c0_g1_i4:49-585(+)